MALLRSTSSLPVSPQKHGIIGKKLGDQEGIQAQPSALELGASKLVLMPYLDMLLRRAEPDDAIAVARVHVRSWQAAYRTLLPDDYLDQLRPEDRAQKYDFASLDPQKPGTIVAVEEGMIYGSRPRRHRANRVYRIMESCVRSMWIPNSGTVVLAWPLCRPLVPVFSNSDFEMRFCGS